MIGRTILHYEIVEKLGEGGMGVVYKARDTHLDRFVAIKVLPPERVADPERKRRFIQEAKAASALNHPNIVTVHDITQDQSIDFMVMEHVAGKTLGQLIPRKGLPLNQTLKYAVQIADALAKAHAKGIVHRDLKPTNIMVTEDGLVKVLDFGLAKLTEPVETDEFAPTRTIKAGQGPKTEEGTIVGTVAYMSPEQAEGKKVDSRSDIFSFGTLLYEMVTSRRAFQGDSKLSTLSAILREDPTPPSQLVEGLPHDLEKVIARCLRKDPAWRFQHMDDVKVALHELQEESDSGKLAATPPQERKRRYGLPWATAVPVRAQRWLLVLAGAVAGALAILIAVALWAPWRASPQPARPIARFSVNLPDSRIVGGGLSSLALSSDGTKLVYVAQSGGTSQLFLRRMDRLETKPLPGTEGATGPFFSPDGNSVGFFAGGKLKKVSLEGGSPGTLCDVQAGFGATWSPDDKIIFCPSSTSGLMSLPASGGTPRVLTETRPAHKEMSHCRPQILPGGKGVLYTIMTGLGLEAQHIAVLSLETGNRRVLIKDATQARYAPTGHLIFAQRGKLLAVPFDVRRLEVTGSPMTVLENLSTSWAGDGQFSVSDSGTLVYLAGAVAQQQSRLVWLDRKGDVYPIPAPKRPYRWPSISPEGRRLAITIPENQGPDTWVWDIQREVLTRVTFDGANHIPVWTPDGSRLTSSTEREASGANLFWKRADGTGEAERLLTSEFHQDPASWTRDGKWLAFSQLDPKTSWDIWLLRLDGEHRAQPFLRTVFGEMDPMISPDGRWLAYSSNESGRFEVYVQPFPGGGRKWQISTEGGREPLWAPDGRELFYRQGNAVMAVPVKVDAELIAGKPRVLFEGPYRPTQGFGHPNYDITPDGKRFVMVQPAEEDQPAQTQIYVVLNWFEELKRLVPSRN